VVDFVQHEPCPSCGSSNNLARYTDGHAYCFGCDHYEYADGEIKTVTTGKKKEFLQGEAFNVSRRGITLDTFNKFKYQQGELNGKRVHIANYFKDGVVVAQKIRFKNKDFTWKGTPKEADLYGANLWSEAGKRIVITEGEIDALSVSQAQQNKWPVVSIPNGAHGAKKDLKKHIKYLEQFEEIILCFDGDEPGQKAAKECVLLFTPGKAKIARLPLKDANEMLKAGRSSELIAALWDAKADKPDGIMSGTEVIEAGEQVIEYGAEYPLATMTEWTYGMRPNEMIAYGAGTGVGKTDFLKRVMGKLIQSNGDKIGTLLLEEPNLTLTLDTIAGQIDGALYHIPDADYDPAQKESTKASIAKHLEMYKVGGPLDTEELLGIIRYMVVGLGCKHIFLDHVTYILDGVGDSDQNAAMKVLMRSLNDLNKELPFTLHYVSHLRKAKAGGKTHEEGGRVTLDDFVGGKAVTQYANYTFALERNQQAETEEERDLSYLRCLKDRYTGQAVGKVITMKYNRHTGQKVEVQHNADETDGKDYF